MKLNEIWRRIGAGIERLIVAVEGPEDDIQHDLGTVPPGPRLRDLVLVVRGVRVDRVGWGPETRLDEGCPIIAGRSWPEWMKLAEAADAALARERRISPDEGHPHPANCAENDGRLVQHDRSC